MLAAQGANFVFKKGQFIIGTLGLSPFNSPVIVVGGCNFASVTGLIDQIHLRQHVILAIADITFCRKYDADYLFGYFE